MTGPRLKLLGPLLLALHLIACASGGKPVGETETWAVSGYLPEKTGEKVYVVMKDGKITSVGTSRPDIAGEKIVETIATIFPGFIDLNARLPAGALPLGGTPRGQYQNRAEWAYKPSLYARYERSVPGRGTPAEACAAQRWSELRALTGGTTAARGTPPKLLPCAENFGVANLEARADFPEGGIYSEDDPVPPAMMEKVFIPHLLPHLERGATYEQAFRKMLEDHKVRDWVARFRGETHNLANALKLLLGRDFEFEPEAMDRKLYEKKAAAIEKFLLGPPYAMKPADARRQMAAMARWIFGDEEPESGGRAGFLKASRDEAAAFDYLAEEGVLTFDPALRAYIGNFEPKTHARAVEALESTNTRGAFFRLGEGARGDPYSASELLLAKRLGYLRLGTVIVGGSAYGENEFAALKDNQISLVWTPFTDLLLYGQSLDVAAALRAGLNISLANGPGSAGAKNLLDQLKIARAYLDSAAGAKVSNRELIEMLTVNPARALRMEDQLGAVKPGYLANLTLVLCSAARNPWDCAVNARPGDLSLVVSAGRPRFGDEAFIAPFSEAGQGEAVPPPKLGSRCDFSKSFARGTSRGPLTSVAGLREAMTPPPEEEGKPGATARRPHPFAPLFTCEDAAYEERFAQYVTPLPNPGGERAYLRRKQGLKDDWNPLAGGR